MISKQFTIMQIEVQLSMERSTIEAYARQKDLPAEDAYALLNVRHLDLLHSQDVCNVPPTQMLEEMGSHPGKRQIFEMRTQKDELGRVEAFRALFDDADLRSRILGLYQTELKGRLGLSGVKFR